MRIIITKPTKERQRYGVRLYAYLRKHRFDTLVYSVIYIRKPGMRRWLCDCPAQLFIETGRRRNCKHIRAVRRNLEA